MIFTGKRSEKPEYITLSEEFFGGQECGIDAKIKVIYDGREGDIINQYVAAVFHILLNCFKYA